MFKTRTDKHEGQAERSALPEGHDDADGPFYVAPEIRDAWVDYADGAPADDFTLLTRTMRVIAINRYREEKYPELFQGTRQAKLTQGHTWDPRREAGPASTMEMVEVPPRYRSHLLHNAAHVVLKGLDQAQDVAMLHDGSGDWVDRHLSLHGEEIRQEAAHSIRLNHVLGALVAQDAERRRAEGKHRQFLCPQCGHSDQAQGAPVARALAPESRARIVSCLACYFVALDRLAERAAAKQCGEFPHMRTRAQIIDSYLDEKGL